jgi:polar amino acid transport system substrate-binding protein
MGVKIEFVPTEWSGIIPALLTGKFDVIIGGMGYRTVRAMKVNFTVPYNSPKTELAINKKTMPGITSLEEINKEDTIISVRMGSIPAMRAKENFPKAKLHQFDDNALVIQDVLNGNAHLALAPGPSPAIWEADYPKVIYRLYGEKFNLDPDVGTSCIAVRKGDPDSIFFFNSWIISNKRFLKERNRYWFSSTDWRHLAGK